MEINGEVKWKMPTGKFCWKSLHKINGRYSNYYSCTVTKRIVTAKVRSKKYIKQFISSSRGEQHSIWRRVQTADFMQYFNSSNNYNKFKGENTPVWLLLKVH